MVVAAPPGQTFLDGISLYHSWVFPFEQAKNYLRMYVKNNEKAGRRVQDAKVVRGTWDIDEFSPFGDPIANE